MTNNIEPISKLVWHYTRLQYLPLIKESGALHPKSEVEAYSGAAKSSLNMSTTKFIWFSSNHSWEPSAPQLGGGLRSRFLRWQDLATKYSAIRFGINSGDERLLNWQQTCSAGGANRKERRLRQKLAVQVKKIGADASKWFTSLEPLPLDDLYFQMWLNDEWTEIDIDLVLNKIQQLGLTP